MFMAFVVAVSSFGVDVFRNEVSAECGPPKMWQIDEQEPDFETMIKLFKVIERIPMAVVYKGKNEIIQWFNTHTEFRIPKQPRIRGRGAAGCPIAIGLALATLLFTPAKIVKVKDFIKAAGGVNRWATKLVDAYKRARDLGFDASTSISLAKQEAVAAAGPELGKVILSIIGVEEVMKECFGD